MRSATIFSHTKTINTFFVDGPGDDAYISELVDFTVIDDTHNDQVDWTSGAYMLLACETEPELEVLVQYEMG